MQLACKASKGIGPTILAYAASLRDRCGYFYYLRIVQSMHTHFSSTVLGNNTLQVGLQDLHK